MANQRRYWILQKGGREGGGEKSIWIGERKMSEMERICTGTCQKIIHPHIHLYIYYLPLSINLSIYQSTYLSIYLFYQSILLSINHLLLEDDS